MALEPRRELQLGEPEQAIPVYRLVGISRGSADEPLPIFPDWKIECEST